MPKNSAERWSPERTFPRSVKRPRHARTPLPAALVLTTTRRSAGFPWRPHGWLPDKANLIQPLPSFGGHFFLDQRVNIRHGFFPNSERDNLAKRQSWHDLLGSTDSRGGKFRRGSGEQRQKSWASISAHHWTSFSTHHRNWNTGARLRSTNKPGDTGFSSLPEYSGSVRTRH